MMEKAMVDYKLKVCDPDGCEMCKMGKAMNVFAYRTMISIEEYLLDEYTDEMYGLCVDILRALQEDTHSNYAMKWIMQMLMNCDEDMASVLRVFVMDNEEKIICFVNECIEVGTDLSLPF